MNTVFDFAPLWRSGIGIDHLVDMLGQAAKVASVDKYPPYDIEKTGEDALPFDSRAGRLDAR